MNLPTRQITQGANVISSGVTPIASANQTRKPSATVAEVSPGIYSAAMKTGLSKDESRLIEEWAFIQKTHKKLMGMSSADAGKEYQSLDPTVQAALNAYYKVDYANKPDANSLVTNKTARDIIGLDDGFGVWDAIKSPFKGIFKVGEAYGKAVNMPGNIAQMQAVTGGQFITGQNDQVALDAAWDGKALYNPEYVDPLIQKYGGARSFVAMKLLTGMTPGEIIDAWGPNDPDMLTAINEAFEDQDNFKLMLDDFERAQISPGRTIAHKINEKFNIDEKNHPWLFKLGSGSIDLAYQIFADPMTYLTGGTGTILKGIGRAGKGSSLIRGTATDVMEHFADPRVREYWTGLSDELGKYRSAVDSNNLKEAGDIRTGIRNNYPEYANDAAIKLFTTGEKPIKDIDSAIAFFEQAHQTSKLMRLRVSGITYSREGAATMQKGRNLTTGMRTKTREFFQGKSSFDELDDADITKLISNLEDLGKNIDGNADVSELMTIIDKNAKKGVRGALERLSARHPGNREIYTSDEKFTDTLDLIREQAYIAIGNKQMAEIVAIKYSNLGTQAERLAMRKALDEVTMRRMGVDKVSGGNEFISNILGAKYGYIDPLTESKTSTMSASGKLIRPTRFGGEPGLEKEVIGTILPYQNTSAIGALPWTEIKNFMASKTFEQIDTAADVVPKLIGGAFNNKYVESLTDVWTTFTLAPRLGIRTAIDEGFMFSMYMTAGLGREFLNAKRAGNILTAFQGSNASTGWVKDLVQGGLSKIPGIGPVGAKRAIPLEVREGIRDAYLAKYKAGEIDASEIDALVKSDIFKMAIDRFGKNLPETHKGWLREAALFNPAMLDDASSRAVNNALMGRTGAVSAPKSLLDETQLTQAMEAMGVRPTDAFNTLAAQSLSDDKLIMAMYRNFYLGFGTKPYKLVGNKIVSPAGIFMRHNALSAEDGSDYNKAVQEFMENVGFKKEGDNYIIVNEKLVDDFLGQSRQNIKDGASKSAIAEDFIDTTFSELSFRFHGDSEKVNTTLLDYFKKQATESGKPMPFNMVVENLDFDTYRELVKNNKNKNLVTTDLDFGPKSVKLEDWMTRFQDKVFSAMSRTTDDIFRQPVVHAHYFVFRKQYEALERKYSDELFSQMDEGISETTRRKRADQMAARYFTEHSLEDAVHHTLKYSDNPEVRTVFAHNVRTVGRFYRAVEDFQRRMYRLVKERGLSAVYKARLMNQGLSAVGSVHEDQDGKAYLVLPMDDQMFQLVDTTLRTLSREQLGVNQPLFNDFTMKLSAGNPSFQDDAGVPYLSGPMASLSILGIQSLMKKFDPAKNMAEDLDNLLLGNIGDNVTLRKAVFPRSLEGVWKLLTSDEKNQQEVSATMQAISYYQANKYGIYPNDPKYVKIDPITGAKTKNEELFQEDINTYIKNVQIAGHNIIWLRNLLGLISPIAPTLQETKDLPEYMKHNGMTSIRQSFFDVLENVETMYPDAEDHYELAIAVWSGENRGKLAYMPSRNDSSVNVVMNYSNQMQNWILKNSDAVDKYGNAAILFAPNVGEFSSGVYNWAKAADLINQRPVEDYLDEVVMQDSINAYFDLDDAETEELSTRVLAGERRATIDKYTELKRQMRLTTPFLETRVRDMGTNEPKIKFINDVETIVNDPNVDIDDKTRSYVNAAFDLYNSFMSNVERSDIRNASNSADVKRGLKASTLDKLYKLAEQDESGVVKQLIRVGFKGLMNSKSRDAQNTIK